MCGSGNVLRADSNFADSDIRQNVSSMTLWASRKTRLKVTRNRLQCPSFLILVLKKMTVTSISHPSHSKEPHRRASSSRYGTHISKPEAGKLSTLRTFTQQTTSSLLDVNKMLVSTTKPKRVNVYKQVSKADSKRNAKYRVRNNLNNQRPLEDFILVE